MGTVLVNYNTLNWQQSESCTVKVKSPGCQNEMILFKDFNNVEVCKRCNV